MEDVQVSTGDEAPPVKDLRVSVRVRNNRLLSRREALGLSQKDTAASAGIPVAVLSRYEVLKKSPLREGSWQQSALHLSAFYGCLPEELWPDQILAIKESFSERNMDAHEVDAMVAPQQADVEARELKAAVHDALAGLEQNERAVLTARFGLDGGGEMLLHEVGATMGLGRERVRQIEAKALRRLRSPRFGPPLKVAAGLPGSDHARARTIEHLLGLCESRASAEPLHAVALVADFDSRRYMRTHGLVETALRLAAVASNAVRSWVVGDARAHRAPTPGCYCARYSASDARAEAPTPELAVRGLCRKRLARSHGPLVWVQFVSERLGRNHSPIRGGHALYALVGDVVWGPVSPGESPLPPAFAAVQVPCRRCGAQPLAMCHTSGGAVRLPHAARHERFAQVTLSSRLATTEEADRG